MLTSRWRQLMARVFTRLVGVLRPAASLGGGRAAVGVLRRIRGMTFIVYHEITDSPAESLPGVLVTSTARFAREIAWLRRHFEIVSLDEAFRRIQQGAFISHGVVLCFDDGYRGVAQHAYPLLREAGIPATVFINSAFYAGQDVGLRLKVEFLLRRRSWDQLRRLCPDVRDGAHLVQLAKYGFSSSVRDSIGKVFQEAGGAEVSGLYLDEDDVRKMSPALITVANHTRTHRWLAQLTPEQQEQEIMESHRTLESLPHFRPYLALPFGTPDSFNEATLALAQRYYHGYYLTAYGGVNTRARGRSAVYNVLRNTVSDRKPPLLEVLAGNYATALFVR